MSRPPRENPDRLPPYDERAEEGVIGCILWSASECLDACAEAFGAQAGAVFYQLKIRMLYDRLQAMHEARKAIDLTTLQSELKKNGELEQVGGVTFLSYLQDAVPSAANLSYYTDTVVELWQVRELIRVCTEVAGELYADKRELSVDEAAAALERGLNVVVNIANRQQERDIKSIIRSEVIPELEGHYTRGRAQIIGLTTGLEYVDKVLCGMGGNHGNYYVIAARPNVGKTSLVTQIAMHASLDYARWEALAGAELETFKATGVLPLDRKEKPLPHSVNDDGTVMVRRVGTPVAISSLEMKGGALVQKMLFQRGSVDLQKWRTGYAQESDLKLLTMAAGGLAGENTIYIDDTPRLRIGQLKARWRRWHRQYGVRLFILDYLQLMQSDKRSGRPDRVQELAEVSAEIQALGKELNCPMIILAQMNRDYEKDPNRAPRMSDLKDCGAVEQDADVIGFLYAPRLSDKAEEFYDNAMEQFYEAEMVRRHGRDWKEDEKIPKSWKQWDGKPERINVLFAKNRFGPKGRAELLLQHTSTTFSDWVGWLKENKIRPPARGEESRYADADDDANHADGGEPGL